MKKTDDYNPVAVLIDIIKAKRFYFAKFIDWFVDEVPVAHQRALLAFIVANVSNERWERKLEDEFSRIELVKSILYYYSGRDDIKSEPSARNLIELITDYMDSKECLLADSEAEDDVEKPAFADMMGELDGE